MEEPYALFPDANLTLRLSYGQVKGYQPRDGVVYRHQTTIEGVMEKEDPGNWEFVVPGKLRKLYREKDFGPYTLSNGSLPVAFAATTHTTGGNSGSPVMNGNGELIGINFDRNWELTENTPAPTITAPTLFLAGTADPVLSFTPRDRVHDVATGDYREVLIEGAGHWLQQERPDAVNAVLLEFLSGL